MGCPLQIKCLDILDTSGSHAPVHDREAKFNFYPTRFGQVWEDVIVLLPIEGDRSQVVPSPKV